MVGSGANEALHPLERKERQHKMGDGDGVGVASEWVKYLIAHYILVHLF